VDVKDEGGRMNYATNDVSLQARGASLGVAVVTKCIRSYEPEGRRGDQSPIQARSLGVAVVTASE